MLECYTVSFTITQRTSRPSRYGNPKQIIIDRNDPRGISHAPAYDFLAPPFIHTLHHFPSTFFLLLFVMIPCPSITVR